MGCIYITWAMMCYTCSLILEATHNGWLAEKGEHIVEMIQTICKWFMGASIIAVIVLLIFQSIL